MEALHKNVEWTEVIEVLTPFFGESIERKIFAGLLRPADYVRNIEVPTSLIHTQFRGNIVCQRTVDARIE